MTADFGVCVTLRLAHVVNQHGVPQLGHTYNGPLRPTDYGAVEVHADCTGAFAEPESGDADEGLDGLG